MITDGVTNAQCPIYGTPAHEWNKAFHFLAQPFPLCLVVFTVHGVRPGLPPAPWGLCPG